MKRTALAIGMVVAAIAAGATCAWSEESSHRLGVGAHYWRALSDIDVDEVDQDGMSWIASYQYRPGWLGIEADVEWFEKGFGGAADDVYEPQLFLLLGKGLYAGAGIGGYYTDNEFASDPFYALKAGLDVEVLWFLRLDVNANYRFEQWDDLSAEGKEIDTDTVTLGAALRLAF
jgi:hypothetical protein